MGSPRGVPFTGNVLKAVTETLCPQHAFDWKFSAKLTVHRRMPTLEALKTNAHCNIRSETRYGTSVVQCLRILRLIYPPHERDLRAGNEAQQCGFPSFPLKIRMDFPQVDMKSRNSFRATNIGLEFQFQFLWKSTPFLFKNFGQVQSY